MVVISGEIERHEARAARSSRRLSMKTMVCLGLACALLSPAWTLANGPASWKGDVLIRAKFGDAPDEYGRRGLGDGPEEGPKPVVVSCFDVAPKGIFVFDWFKQDIKVYTLAGEYQRTIKPVRYNDYDPVQGVGRFEPAMEASDILAVGNEIYLLIDTSFWKPGIPDIDWAPFQVFSFDVQSGERRARLLVKNPEVGTYLSKLDGKRHNANQTVQLAWQGKVLALYDHSQELCYPVTRDGEPVDPSGATPMEGSTVDQYRIRDNHETGRIELLDNLGQFIRTLPGDGGTIALASDTDHYATSRGDERPGIVVTVHSVSGGVVGEAIIPRREQWEDNPQSYWRRFEFHDGSLYEVFVNDEGVHVVKWHSGGGAR
jgi:hypothetical protein